MPEGEEGLPISQKTISKEAQSNKPPSIPDQLSEVWIEQALSAGKVEKDGKELFVRPYPTTPQEKVWLTDNYGLPVPGPDGEGYIYHGTNIESLPEIAANGVFGIPDHPTLSTDNTQEVRNAARNRNSLLKKGVVAVWKSPWSAVEIPKLSWPEPMGWPSKRFEGDRQRLNLPDHLKNADDLRQLPPDKLIGFYIIEQR